jgi:ADP-ribosylglycohydrolase
LKDNSLKISLDSLIFFSCLHFGDNDTTGAIAGAWYGAMYGFKNFDQEKLKPLEFKEQLNKITNEVIKFQK